MVDPQLKTNCAYLDLNLNHYMSLILRAYSVPIALPRAFSGDVLESLFGVEFPTCRHSSRELLLHFILDTLYVIRSRTVDECCQRQLLESQCRTIFIFLYAIYTPFVLYGGGGGQYWIFSAAKYNLRNNRRAVNWRTCTENFI